MPLALEGRELEPEYKRVSVEVADVGLPPVCVFSKVKEGTDGECEYGRGGRRSRSPPPERLSECCGHSSPTSDSFLRRESAVQDPGILRLPRPLCEPPEGRPEAEHGRADTLEDDPCRRAESVTADDGLTFFRFILCSRAESATADDGLTVFIRGLRSEFSFSDDSQPPSPCFFIDINVRG